MRYFKAAFSSSYFLFDMIRVLHVTFVTVKISAAVIGAMPATLPMWEEQRVTTKEDINLEASVSDDSGRSSWRSIAAIVLMIVLQLPIGGYMIPGASLAAQTGREAIYWVLTVILIGYVLFVEHRPISSVRLKWPTWKSLAFGLAGGVAMIAGMALIYIVIFPALGLSSIEGGLIAVKALPVWLRVMLIIRAAVFEELCFRGFMIERLTEITGFRWLAAAISLAAFTFAHLGYWGWPHLIIAGFGGVILTGLYLWRGDLSCNMIAHFLTDGVGFLIG